MTAAARTDRDGRARLDVLDSPNGTVRIRGDGFFDRTVPAAEVDAGTEVSISPMGRLHVDVRDGSGVPVHGAYVTVRLSDRDTLGLGEQMIPLVRPGYVARYTDSGLPVPEGDFVESGTGPSGTLELERLPCGVRLRVRVEGPVLAEEQTLVIDPTRREARVAFDVERGSVVEGIVARADGSPLPHPLFLRLDPGFRERSAPVFTTPAEDGSYRFEGVPRGTARIRVLQGGAVTAQATHVVEDDVETVPTIWLEDLAVVAGQLVYEGGDAHGAFLVEVYGAGLRRSTKEISGSGAFTLEMIEGEYTLVVKRYLALAEPTELARAKVDVPATTKVEIDLSPALAAIRGTLGMEMVEGSGPLAANFYEVGASGGRGARVFAGTTDVDESGSWLVGTALAGTYDIEFACAGRPLAVRRQVALEAGRTTDLGELEPLGLIECTGRCSYDDGRPVAGQKLIFKGKAARRTCTTDPAGAFELTGLPGGLYRVERALDGNLGQAIGQVALTDSPMHVELRCPAPGRIECSLNEHAAGGGLFGLRIPEGDAPVPRRLQRTAPPNGIMTFDGLMPGAYVVSYQPDPDARLRARKAIELGEGETVRVEFGAETIARQVSFEVDGRPLTDVELVHAFSLEDAGTGTVIADSAIPDRKGIARVDLPEGAGRLRRDELEQEGGAGFGLAGLPRRGGGAGRLRGRRSGGSLGDGADDRSRRSGAWSVPPAECALGDGRWLACRGDRVRVSVGVGAARAGGMGAPDVRSARRCVASGHARGGGTVTNRHEVGVGGEDLVLFPR